MTTTPQKIYLKDYLPPAFFTPEIYLIVDIYHERTVVESKMKVIKNVAFMGSNEQLELNGEQAELLEVWVNGVKLQNNEFSLTAEKLLIPHFHHDEAEVVVKSVINPEKNFTLDGFYKSGTILCTQCEPEGFRKIAFSVDRPDNMCSVSTLLKADKTKYPYLLSNGNLIEKGDLGDNRHFALWKDPHKKPCYLFAMVAGDLEKVESTYISSKNQEIKIEFFVDHGQGYKCHHAIESLKNAMRWDEEKFGLHYDLDIYMVVAVESFNFGAMENKGLNIFNSAYVLADQKTATDTDYQNIEGVIGHEYFHNWTGNRITCRDWFQLTLKEGLTVFRDQEFSSDQLSRAVKRIEDVRRLKESQFPEDQGPLSHPIRPESYIEINNFYTATVYEKGAEVIRMLETLLGKEVFNRGVRHYLKKFDGKAVTTDDFISAHEENSGKDLKQFRNWYKRAGTPKIKILSDFNLALGELTLKVEQHYPFAQEKNNSQDILHFPLIIGFVNDQGKELHEQVTLEIKNTTETFVFNLKEKPILSINRGFSAPVLIDYEYSYDQLASLAAFDSDPYVKAESMQIVFQKIIKNHVENLKSNKSSTLDLQDTLKIKLLRLVTNPTSDFAFESLLWTIPSEGQMLLLMDEPLIEEVCLACRTLEKVIGDEFYEQWESRYQALSLMGNEVFDVSSKSMGIRSLRNRCLSFMLASGRGSAIKYLEKHYDLSNNMTDQSSALSRYCKFNLPGKDGVLNKFYQQWSQEPLVMLRWFSSQVSFAPVDVAFELIENLSLNKAFRKEVPNDLRSLYGSFMMNNLLAFHHPSGKGYDFMTKKIQEIDTYNPQVGARLLKQFGLISKLKGDRKEKAKSSLKWLVSQNISKDLFEVANEYLK